MVVLVAVKIILQQFNLCITCMSFNVATTTRYIGTFVHIEVM